jgi:glycosyltransferase involved in cell wall biosynthesis
LDWDLRIIGPDSRGHLKVVRDLAEAVGAERIEFTGMVSDEEKGRSYARADMFVLPTLVENYALAVAEALAAGIPAIVTKGAPWSGLETERCGFWIDHGESPLEAALRRAMLLPREELLAMGARGRAWMIRDFSWRHCAERFEATYRWALDEGDRPSWVQLD